MTAKLLIAAAALTIAAGTLPAKAVSVTSDPDATMNEQQKLGPAERTVRHGNAYVTHRHRHAYRSGLVYGSAVEPWGSSYGYYSGPGYAYERPGYVYGSAPGFSIYAGAPGYAYGEPLYNW